MPIVRNDVILPNSALSAGVRGRQKRMNRRTVNQGGFVDVDIIWASALREFEIAYVPTRVDAWQAVSALHEVTAGGAYGFLMEDPTDSYITPAQGVLLPVANGMLVGTGGAGFGVPTYLLGKRYTSAGSVLYSDRKITRPKGTIAMLRSGAAVTIGAAPGNASINADTGLVTFVAEQTQALTSIATGATTVLNFASGVGIVAAMSVGQQVYVSGLTGTAATTLNGFSHQITAKGGTSLTVSTNTAGLAATGGTAALYPQASETLTCSGYFYVPVQFASDDLEWEMVIAGDRAARFLAASSVVLLEVRE
jgi:hypothetical protein